MKKRNLDDTETDETETDEPTVPGTAPLEEAQPEVKTAIDSTQQQPAKKRKSTSSDDEMPSSSMGPVLPPLPYLGFPTAIPNLDGFFGYASSSPLFPYFPLMTPNQFPNIFPADFEMSSSVNIEQPSNEIFESSNTKTGNFHPL